MVVGDPKGSVDPQLPKKIKKERKALFVQREGEPKKKNKKPTSNSPINMPSILFVKTANGEAGLTPALPPTSLQIDLFCPVWHPCATTGQRAPPMTLGAISDR